MPGTFSPEAPTAKQLMNRPRMSGGGYRYPIGLSIQIQLDMSITQYQPCPKGELYRNLLLTMLSVLAGGAEDARCGMDGLVGTGGVWQSSRAFCGQETGCGLSEGLAAAGEKKIMQRHRERNAEYAGRARRFAGWRRGGGSSQDCHTASENPGPPLARPAKDGAPRSCSNITLASPGKKRPQGCALRYKLAGKRALRAAEDFTDGVAIELFWNGQRAHETIGMRIR